MTPEKYLGCFLGLAIGDAYGAAHEGGPLEKFLWKFIGQTATGLKRYTDDTQMSIDIATSYLTQGALNQDHIANQFSHSYRWSRGYGPSAAHILKKIKSGKHWSEVNKARFKEGSFGNGAAMRAPIIALCTRCEDRLFEHVAAVSVITHAHPLAIEGAYLIAFITYHFINGTDIDSILECLPKLCQSAVYIQKLTTCVNTIKTNAMLSNNDIRHLLGNQISATESCITAIYFAFKYLNEPFELLLNVICQLGGDTDTIAAMAGALWGAHNGCSTLGHLIKAVEGHALISDLAIQLHAQLSI